MIRNIPNRYTVDQLLAEFNDAFYGKYDCFYLPEDSIVKIL